MKWWEIQHLLSVSVMYLQTVEGLSQVAYAAPLSCCVLWGVLTPQRPGLDRRATDGTGVKPGPTRRLYPQQRTCPEKIKLTPHWNHARNTFIIVTLIWGWFFQSNRMSQFQVLKYLCSRHQEEDLERLMLSYKESVLQYLKIIYILCDYQRRNCRPHIFPISYLFTLTPWLGSRTASIKSLIKMGRFMSLFTNLHSSSSFHIRASPHLTARHVH